MIQVAFYGRVSTEDQQDPDASRGWQLSRARQLVEPAGATIVQEFFDIGTSRSLPWKRRPEAGRLLSTLSDPDRGFGGVVIGEPQRAFYGNQFGLTFPVFTHYGVQLWVPEVGGPIDPGSEAHDLVMTLYGGMSKGERNRIQVRTRAAMMDLAARTDRFLGGRPPYGYQLVDAGPHPNPGRAATGQRAHKLEPDPVSAPVVERIFSLYAAGTGLRSIAQALTEEGVPSPSAHDPARNTHRDPRGWDYSAVRAILANETYTGRRVWAKQGKVERLIDPNDVAAGNQTRLRWRPEADWVRPAERTHPALVSDDMFAVVRGRLSSQERSSARKPRTTSHPYLLQGLLYCVCCGRRMEGAWRANRRSGSEGRTLYRCNLAASRAVSPELSGHPRSLYVREDAIVGLLDEWIASLVTPEALTASRHEVSMPSPTSTIQADLAGVDRKIAALISALECGAALAQITEQLARRTKEREGLEARLRQLGSTKQVTREQMSHAIDELGGLATILASAAPDVRAKIYASLEIRLDYDHVSKQVKAHADQACVFNRVRRGT